jgi:hypothetical protein
MTTAIIKDFLRVPDSRMVIRRIRQLNLGHTTATSKNSDEFSEVVLFSGLDWSSPVVKRGFPQKEPLSRNSSLIYPGSSGRVDRGNGSALTIGFPDHLT